MNYMEILNECYALNHERTFSSGEWKLYIYLVMQCNMLRWCRRFRLRTLVLENELGMSRRQISEAREGLVERGLVEYTPGSVREGAVYAVTGVTRQKPLGRVSGGAFGVECPEEAGGAGGGDKLRDGGKETVMAARAARGDGLRDDGETEEGDFGLPAINTVEAEESSRKTGSSDPRTEVLAPCKGRPGTYPGTGRRRDARGRDLRKVAEAWRDCRMGAVKSDYIAYLDWTEEHTPYLFGHMMPTTEEQFHSLKREFGSAQLQTNQRDLDNDIGWRDRYERLGPALHKWCTVASR